MEASSGYRTRRAISILLVLILHALLIVALLRSTVRPQTSALMLETHLSEIIINTARPSGQGTRKEAPKPAPAPAAAQSVPPTLIPREPLILQIPTPAPDITGLGQALMGCAPENFTNLDEAQRSRCRKLGALPAYDPGAVDYADRTDKVPGARQWELELARKKAPLLLPCGNSRSADPVYTGACIVANIANGFTFKRQYEDQPAYFDEPGKSQ